MSALSDHALKVLPNTGPTDILITAIEALAAVADNPVVGGQTGIEPIDTGTVDNTYGAPEAGVLADLRTKVDLIIVALTAAGLLAEVEE